MAYAAADSGGGAGGASGGEAVAAARREDVMLYRLRSPLYGSARGRAHHLQGPRDIT